MDRYMHSYSAYTNKRVTRMIVFFGLAVCFTMSVTQDIARMNLWLAIGLSLTVIAILTLLAEASAGIQWGGYLLLLSVSCIGGIILGRILGIFNVIFPYLAIGCLCIFFFFAYQTKKSIDLENKDRPEMPHSNMESTLT